MAPKKTSGKRPLSAGKKSPDQPKSGRSLQLAVAFWLIFFVIIAGLFIVRRPTIKENYNIMAKRFNLPLMLPPESSGGEKPETALPDDSSSLTVSPSPRSVTEPAAAPSTPVKTPVNQPAEPSAKTPEKPESSAPVSPPPAASRPAANQKPAEKPATQTPAPKPAELRERSIYLTQIDKDGAILRVKVTRNIPVSDSPLLDSLNALLAGPTAEEKRKGLISLVPQNTQVISATVRGNTAYISFNEEFQYNTYGVEGYAAQLKQLVWTATEFSTVKDVQILIDGRRIDYLGEGIWIGSPVSRETL